MISRLFATVFAVALSGCAPLMAEAPLFSAADWVGPAPIAQGRWASVDAGCTAIPVAQHVSDRDCSTYEFRRTTGGRWRVRVSSNGASEVSDDVRIDAVLASAVETPRTGFTPIFLAEYHLLDQERPEDRGPYYAAIVPIGPQPAAEMYLLLQITCADVLRDGPVEGVSEATDALPDRCIAHSQAAVRSSVRRALLESMPNLDGARLVHLGRAYEDPEGRSDPKLMVEYDSGQTLED